jgi:hypothetical protein
VAESFLAVTSGSGTKLHTFNRTIGANSVEQQVIQHAEPYLAGYTVTTAATSIATAAAHILQIMAGSSLPVYLRSLRVYQIGLATSAAIVAWDLFRLSTAGTGGTAITPAPLDTTDAASGATAMTLPTGKGTETTKLGSFSSQLIQTVGTGGSGSNPMLIDITPDWLLRMKVHRIAAGTANGIALKQVTGAAAATVFVVASISEASF